ncbi:ANTAR domain-containing protein [Streptomyces sp. WMMC500]|uniref:ANTAR domain-containing protein n=1 Tax=Streptomyces sp. WMMC500 TaxID=3015154 RepID=UPI00248CC6DF|nr:ANTAR domain-containing protein [Streptomyces sp. WMMC500]WBB58213.1 ANTAR domain-containing protein [Streptomyces sp. WMMC500]
MSDAEDLHLAAGTDPVIVRSEMQRDQALLTAWGELVYGSAEILLEAMGQLPKHTRAVTLDMSGVTFMDSAGVYVLFALDDQARKQMIPVEVVNWAGQPLRVVERVGLHFDEDHGLKISLAAPEADENGSSPPHRPSPPDEVPAPSAIALERAEAVERLNEEVEQLKRAIDTRPLIDQARGILMAALHCSDEEAWTLLVETSQRTNTKLRVVAQAVIDSTSDAPLPEELLAQLRQSIGRHRHRHRHRHRPRS